MSEVSEIESEVSERESEVSEEDEEVYPFRFIDSHISLQSMSSSEFALNLWRYKYFSNPPIPTDSTDSFLKNTFSCKELLSVPSCIKATIDEKIEEIRTQLEIWIGFQTKAALFDGDFRYVLPSCFHCIVLSPNGTISFKGTALNLIKANHFSNVEKYKIACASCLEEEVRRIWPLVSKEPRVVGQTVDRFDIMVHWNRRMKSMKDPVSAIRRLEKAYDVANKPAFEYFFDLLPYRRQTAKTITIIGRNDVFATLRLLRKLNMDQAKDVFVMHASTILSMLISKDYFWHLRDLWDAMKNVVFENHSTFFEILRELWIMIFDGNNLNFARRAQINDFLIEVWSSAPDELKIYISIDRVGLFFHKLPTNSFPFSQTYGHDMTFILGILDINDYEVRNRLWRKHWRKVALRTKPSQLEQFMKLCLPDDEAVDEFSRNFILKNQALFKNFMERGLYSDLNDYLHFFVKDPKLIQDLSLRTLKLNVESIISPDVDKLCKFDEFVHSVFFDVAKDVDKFKEQMISSKKSLQCLHKTFYTNTLETFLKIIDVFVPSDQSVGRLKAKMLDYCRDYLNSDRPSAFNYDKWVELIEWCTIGEHDISDFKESLNVDGIFDTHVLNNARRKCGGLYFFEQFAKWYFRDEESLKGFKAEKLRHQNAVCLMGSPKIRKGIPVALASIPLGHDY